MDWSESFLFKGLDSRQLGILEPHLDPASYNAGETIMEEGDPGDFMLLIREGTVDIYKNELKLASRGPGDLVGLMALIDDYPRSADVVAGSNGVEVFKVGRASWQTIMSGDIRATILHNYLVYQQNTLRQTDEDMLEEAREKWRQEHLRVVSARFFVQMVIGLVLFTFAMGSLNELAQHVESTYLSFGVLFVYAVWSFVFLRQSKLPLAAFGLDMSNFKPAVIFALKGTGVFIVAMGVLKWIQITLAPEAYGSNLFDLYANDGGVPTVVLILLYSIHAIMQEFIARGCIQGGLHQFISGKWAPAVAIFLATMMFSVFHLMLDMRLALLTIIPGLLWGFLFYKERNVLAVAISHILIGVVAFFVLGIV